MAFRRPPCPVCADPNAFPLWIDKEDPPMCPMDPAWLKEGPDATPTITNVTECPKQMGRARQAAERRQAAPHCFDENGNMLPGKLGEVMELWTKFHNGKPPPVWMGPGA